MTKTDLQLKQDIEAELRWDPQVSAAQIGVTVENGSVTLLGTVDTYPQKWAAEDATKRVSGVRTVAQDLTVKILVEHTRNDSEIAMAIQNAFKWNVAIPATITAKVEKGHVTLEGSASWNYERDGAERSVRYLYGVLSVLNSVRLKPQASAEQVKEKVEAALKRQAKTDAGTIQIDTSGGRVTLSGHASSWQSIEDAAHAAWAAPGVTEVVDKMKVEMTTS